MNINRTMLHELIEMNETYVSGEFRKEIKKVMTIIKTVMIKAQKKEAAVGIVERDGVVKTLM